MPMKSLPGNKQLVAILLTMMGNLQFHFAHCFQFNRNDLPNNKDALALGWLLACTLIANACISIVLVL